MQVIEAEDFLEEELIAAHSRITEVAMPWWPEEGEVRFAGEGGEEGDGFRRRPDPEEELGAKG
jgi:hypothetical protein